MVDRSDCVLEGYPRRISSKNVSMRIPLKEVAINVPPEGLWFQEMTHELRKISLGVYRTPSRPL